MSRAAFQVLIIPYRIDADGQPRYLLFKRSDKNVWQWIAGGGEDDEEPEQTARREALEEAGISQDGCFMGLDAMASLPAVHVADGQLWGDEKYVSAGSSLWVQVQV